MFRVMVLEDGSVEAGWARQLEEGSGVKGLRFQHMDSIENMATALAKHAADVMVVDITGDKAPRLEFLAEVLPHHPELHTVVVVDLNNAGNEGLQALLRSRSVDFVRTPVDVRELRQRIERFVEVLPQPRSSRGGVTGTSVRRRATRAVQGERAARVRPRGGQSTRPAKPAPSPVAPIPSTSGVTGHLVPDLRAPSGRLDAKKIAAVFGLPLAEVARITGRELSPVHKTPDAASLQGKLALFERIARLLLPLAGSTDGLRMWLNAANPDLAQHTPRELLQQGQGEIVAELLEDAVVGQPG